MGTVFNLYFREQNRPGGPRQSSGKSGANRQKRPTQRAKPSTARHKPSLAVGNKTPSTPSCLQPPRAAKPQSVTPARPSYGTLKSTPSPRRNPMQRVCKENQSSATKAHELPTTRERHMKNQESDRATRSKKPQSNSPLRQLESLTLERGVRATAPTPKRKPKAKSKTSTSRPPPLVPKQDKNAHCADDKCVVQ